jgi:hypothetical protein
LLIAWVLHAGAATSGAHASPRGAFEVEGTLRTRADVPLRIGAVCSDAGRRLIAHEPHEYCGRGLLAAGGGRTHAYDPALRRVRVVSDVEWQTPGALDTALSPSALLDLVCATGEAPPGGTPRFSVIARRDVAADDEDFAVGALIRGAHAASCATARSLKLDGASHAGSGLTVRDHPTGRVVVAWVEPFGPCMDDASGPAGTTCLKQVGTAPAERGGVAVGDLVVRVGGQLVSRAEDVPALLDGADGSAEVWMYRGQVSPPSAHDQLAAATCGREVTQEQRVLGRVYCWRWGRESPPGRSSGGDEPPAPSAPTLSGEERERKFAAYFAESGCPSCEDIGRLNTEYLAYVKRRGCVPSDCKRAAPDRPAGSKRR